MTEQAQPVVIQSSLASKWNTARNRADSFLQSLDDLGYIDDDAADMYADMFAICKETRAKWLNSHRATNGPSTG